ncbi:DUF4384 domain-containing protein [Edaphobacter sp.]|uniref:DUF4384 domain-containing protein n=1 Tax=Edaphobacter sp. TaxID=1934404 RepID=UPI002DB932FF|nr:DUF4384 domain-containing protein [Edaphobacter sp.]HEU5341504.1 DUF4384 domain-containing protein [Edaphobacter sp.]
MKKLLVLSLLFGFCIVCAQAQTADDGLTARDAFWSASDLVSVAPNPAAKTAAASAASATSKSAKKTAKVHIAKHKASPKEIDSTPDTAGTEMAERHHAGSQIDPQLVTASGYGAQPHLVRVSAKMSAQPFGLRYTLLARQSDGGYSEVFPETVFHSGDKVKLSVMANQPGYLYIIEQGSSGSWIPLFPAQNAAPESNHVEAGRVYLVPSASDESFQFNQQPGKEHLFILLSREPIADLDQVIFGLQRKSSAPASAPAPTSTAPTPPHAAPLIVADNRITDALVEKLQSRDLTLVKDTSQQETSDEQYGEKAIYVVNHGKDAASRVFASLILDHE